MIPLASECHTATPEWLRSSDLSSVQPRWLAPLRFEWGAGAEVVSRANSFSRRARRFEASGISGIEFVSAVTLQMYHLAEFTFSQGL